jgi:hypothetical protein
VKKGRRIGALPVQHRGRSMPVARSLRSPLLVTAELRPLGLDVVPPAGQRGGETAGRSKAVPSPIALPSVPAGEGVVASAFTFFVREEGLG